VAELLLSADGGAVEARDLLARHGMALTDIKNGDGNRHRYLAVAQHSGAIERMLDGTSYEAGYEAQIRRHPLCKEGEPSVVKLAGKSTRCRCLSWTEFKASYLGSAQGSLEGIE
jgi:hypothetical protein